jgi:hypothetical protein
MADTQVEEYTVSQDDVGTLQVNGTDDSDKFTVTLPSRDDVEAVSQFITSLSDKQAVHGVKSLTKWATKYLNHVTLCESMWQHAVLSANNINGIRGTSQLKGDKKRSLRHTAEVFYGSLSTPVLRAQCTVFNLDYDSFDSIDDVITALVDRSVEVTVA